MTRKYIKGIGQHSFAYSMNSNEPDGTKVEHSGGQYKSIIWDFGQPKFNVDQMIQSWPIDQVTQFAISRIQCKFPLPIHAEYRNQLSRNRIYLLEYSLLCVTQVKNVKN